MPPFALCNWTTTRPKRTSISRETKRILDWDLDGAEAEFNRAVEIDPNSTPSNYFIAALYAARGDRDKALAYLQRTSKIDPASLWVSNFACELYRYFGLVRRSDRGRRTRAATRSDICSYGEPTAGSACIARWGASMMQLHSTKRRESSPAGQGLVWRSLTRA